MTKENSPRNEAEQVDGAATEKRKRHVLKVIDDGAGTKCVRVAVEILVDKGDLTKLVAGMLEIGTVLKPGTARGLIAEEMESFTRMYGTHGFSGQLNVKPEFVAKATIIVQFLFPELEG